MSKTYIPASLRRLIHRRAQGRCEYCLVSQEVALLPFEIEHVIAEKHGGETSADNLALACFLCNRYKGSDIASIDPQSRLLAALFNPRFDTWSEHFQLDDGKLAPLTAVGRVTVSILQLNLPDRIDTRRQLIQAGLYPLT